MQRPEGLFALSSDHQLGMSLFSTDAFCSGPTGEVEEQLDKVLSENRGMLWVSVADDTMTWGNETGPQMIWSR